MEPLQPVCANNDTLLAAIQGQASSCGSEAEQHCDDAAHDPWCPAVPRDSAAWQTAVQFREAELAWFEALFPNATVELVLRSDLWRGTAGPQQQSAPGRHSNGSDAESAPPRQPTQASPPSSLEVVPLRQLYIALAGWRRELGGCCDDSRGLACLPANLRARTAALQQARPVGVQTAEPRRLRMAGSRAAADNNTNSSDGSVEEDSSVLGVLLARVPLAQRGNVSNLSWAFRGAHSSNCHRTTLPPLGLVLVILQGFIVVLLGDVLLALLGALLVVGILLRVVQARGVPMPRYLRLVFVQVPVPIPIGLPPIFGLSIVEVDETPAPN